ncbi:MAG: aminoacyl-tRNA deacylase [Gemmatimonadales bacterium]
MPVERLKKFLDDAKIRYVTILHSPAYTAQEIAATAHVSGRELAKTVIVKVDGKMAMAVLPASSHVEFDMLRDALGAKKVELASESEFKDLFPGCEPGAMPPFGNLYDMDVYVADSLAQDAEIAFNAGSHTELIKLAYQEFARLVEPKVLRFAAQNVA